MGSNDQDTEVQEILGKYEKRAAKEKPDEEGAVADDNPVVVEDGGDVMVSESADQVTKKTAPKKTTVRVDKGEEANASGSGLEILDESILNGNAGKRISTTLPLTPCITNTRPEYAK